MFSAHKVILLIVYLEDQQVFSVFAAFEKNENIGRRACIAEMYCFLGFFLHRHTL